MEDPNLNTRLLELQSLLASSCAPESSIKLPQASSALV
jgi:hypothetical protein